jgi:hypothetical protein
LVHLVSQLVHNDRERERERERERRKRREGGREREREKKEKKANPEKLQASHPQSQRERNAGNTGQTCQGPLWTPVLMDGVPEGTAKRFWEPEANLSFKYLSRFFFLYRQYILWATLSEIIEEYSEEIKEK